MAKDVLITPASGSIEVKNDADALKVSIVAETVTTSDKTLTLPNKTGTLAVTTDVPNITGAASTVVTDNLTASRAVVSNSSGKIDVSTVTSTELGYVSGVTSAIQTQLNGKQATLTNPVTGTGTANQLTYWTATGTVGTLAVATYPSLTELSYVKGVTSAIQTQIDGTVKTTGNQTIAGAKSFSGSISLTASGPTDALNLNNNNITGVNHITINDPGPNEGIEWVGGNTWKIYESPNDLTTNSGGNLQIVQNTTRRATFNTSGQLDIPVATGTAPLVISSTTAVTNLNADLIDGVDSSRIVFGDNTTKTTTISNLNTPLASGFYESYLGTGNPTSTWYSILNVRHTNTANNYGFQFAGDFFNSNNIFYRSLQGSNPTAVTWNKIWHDGNDGAGSTLDADLLDGNQASAFVLKTGDTMTGALTVNNSINGNRYFQNATGIPTNNLGSPTVTEMALFDEQFDNKTAFYPIANLKFYTSTDNITFTEYTTPTDTQKRRFLGGDANAGITIPNLTPYFRIEVTNANNYVFLNALYIYWSSQSHSTTVKIRARRRSDLAFIQWTNSSSTVSAWPGHLYLPFSTIPWLTGGSSSGHYDIVHIDFQPTWSGNATYGTFPIILDKLQLWGGYPAGKRNVYSTDENRNVAFPAALTGTRLFSTIATGTSPLSVTSTTVNTNLNADLVDGLHSSSLVQTSGDQTITGTKTFSNDVIVTGNLTINGTTTNINTTNLVVEDKNIVIGDVATPTDVTADGGGITLKGATDKTITWVDSTDRWTSNQVFGAPNYVSTVATGTQPYATTSTTVNTNLNADLLDGLHSTSLSKRVNLTGQVQTTDFRKSVIALCELTNTNPSLNSYSIGMLTFHRTNGLVAPVLMQIAMEKTYNVVGANYTSLVQSGDSYGDNVQYIKFQYNGIWYGGVEFFFSDATLSDVTFHGESNFAIFGLDYYNTQTSTVINSEINSSITTTGMSAENDLFLNNNKVWNSQNDGAGSGLDADLLDGLNATSANTASTIVARDSSGNFSAGAISGTSLSTGSGASTWSIDDNTANVLTFKDGATTRLEIKSGGLFVNGSTTPVGSGTVTSVGATSPIASSGGTTPTISVASGFTIPTSTEKGNYDTAYTGVNTATNANTVSTIVKRDASGNFSAGTITASLTGTASGNLTSASTLTAGNLSGTIPSAVLGNSTVFIGSTSVALNRATGTLALTDVTNTNWDSAYTHSTTTTGSIHGSTTVGGSLLRLANPGAITFLRVNADNTVTARSASDFRTDIGAGTGNGTVTSVTGTSPVASSGGTTPAISLASGYGDTQNPYASKTQKTFLAAPNAADGVPTFRTIVASDVPTLNQSTTGSAGSVANSLVLKVDTGTTEGTDLYTFNGSSAKTVDFKSGTNVTLTDTAGVVTFSSPSLSLGTTSGSGNAVTDIAVSGHTVTMTKGSTFLTGNQSITLSGDVTGTGSTAITTALANSGVTAASYTAASITVDAKGRVTSASSNTIPTVNDGTLTLAVSGTGLSGSASFTANQSTASTFTVTSNATSANTASTIVARDSSGNFSAGAITGTSLSTGSGASTWTIDDNTANVLTFKDGATTRLEIKSGGLFVNGSTTALGSGAVTSVGGTSPIASSGGSTPTISVASGFTIPTSTEKTNYDTAYTDTNNATNSNTASRIVKRDASGNFSAGTITASLTGTASGNALTSHTHGNIQSNGTITAASVTIESGDTLLITNNNNSQLIERGIAFGTSTTSFLANNGTWVTPSGSGDVVGPASSTNNAFALFDGTTGKLIKSATSFGNITSAGAIGSTSGLAVVTTTSGVLTTASRLPLSNLPTSATANRILKVGTANTDPAYSALVSSDIPTLGNITNAGAIGSTSGLNVVTTTSGVLTTEAKFTNLYTNSTPLTISSGGTQTITLSASAQTINQGTTGNPGTYFRIVWGPTTSTYIVSYAHVMPTSGSDAFTYISSPLDIITGNDLYYMMYIRANATGTYSGTSWIVGGGKTMTMTGTQTTATMYLRSIDRVNI